jgi:hypothetical protein
MGKQQNTFTFKHVKSHDFKTVKIDGIFGGVNARREINLNFFIDTIDIPKQVVHQINGIQVGKQIQTDPIQSAVREIPFSVNMDVPTAKSVVIWLNEKIKEAETVIKSLEGKEATFNAVS